MQRCRCFGVYTRAMRLLVKPIGIAASLSLLVLQLSGLHVHADEHGYIGAPETSYEHSHVHQDHRVLHDQHRADLAHADHAAPDALHDHGDARDLSFFDLALSGFKLPLAIIALVVLIVLMPRVRTLASEELVRPILSGRHTRWRPPLRAPPRAA